MVCKILFGIEYYAPFIDQSILSYTKEKKIKFHFMSL